MMISKAKEEGSRTTTPPGTTQDELSPVSSRDNSPLTITNTDQSITPEPTNVEGLTPQDENINNGVSPPSSTPCADDMQGYVNKDAAGDEDDSGSPSPLPATIISKEVKPDVGRLSKNNGNNLSTLKDISCCGSTPEVTPEAPPLVVLGEVASSPLMGMISPIKRHNNDLFLDPFQTGATPPPLIDVMDVLEPERPAECNLIEF